MIIEF